jgi:hypothetical protein
MKIVNHLDDLNVGDKSELAEQRKRMSELRGTLRLFDSASISQDRSLLSNKLADYSRGLTELSEFITRRFLTHTQNRQLQDMVNQ